MSFTPLDLQVNIQSLQHTSTLNANQQSFAQAEAVRENKNLKKETILKDSQVDKAKSKSDTEELSKSSQDNPEAEDNLIIAGKNENKSFASAHKKEQDEMDQNKKESENEPEEIAIIEGNHIDIKA